MKLALRKGVPAEQIAALHRHLADAHVALAQLPKAALTKASGAAVWKIQEALHRAALDLEAPLMAATGDRAAPFAQITNPDAWSRWLTERTGMQA